MNTFVYFRINFFAISIVLLLAILAFYPFHPVYFLFFSSLLTLVAVEMCLLIFKAKYLLFVRIDKTTYLVRNWRGQYKSMENAEFQYANCLCFYRLAVVNKDKKQSYYFISKPRLAFSSLDETLNANYSLLNLSSHPKSRRKDDLATSNYFSTSDNRVRNN